MHTDHASYGLQTACSVETHGKVELMAAASRLLSMPTPSANMIAILPWQTVGKQMYTCVGSHGQAGGTIIPGPHLLIINDEVCHDSL